MLPLSEQTVPPSPPPETDISNLLDNNNNEINENAGVIHSYSETELNRCINPVG
jgi:hypothetical protein